MRIAKWFLAAAIVGGAQSADAQQPWPVYVNNAYYYPQGYPQRPYYQNPYPTNYSPAQQAQALYGMQPPYPVMGNPAASNYYRPPGPTPGVANGGWNLNYYPTNVPSTSTSNVPQDGMPVTPVQQAQALMQPPYPATGNPAASNYYVPQHRMPVTEVPASEPPVGRSGHTPTCGLVVGGSAYYLRPYLNNSTAFTLNVLGTDGNQLLTTPEFSWQAKVAPAIYLGWVTECGLGLRGRFFSFAQDSNTLTASSISANNTIIPPIGVTLPAITIPGLGTQSFGSPGVFVFNSGGTAFGTDSLTFKSSLSIQTVDVEVTYSQPWRFFDLGFGAGARQLRLSQQYHATLVNQIAVGTGEKQTLDADLNFVGAGPTVSMQARTFLGGSCFALFAGARGSVLVGTNRQQNSYSLTITDPNNILANPNGATSLFQTNTSRTTNNQVVPTMEIEVGVEAALGSSGLFLRGAAVSQTYFNINNNNGSLGLFGGQVSLGFNF